MVRAAEGPPAGQDRVDRLARRGMHACGARHLILRKRRKDGCEGAGEHRLSRPWRPHEQNAVPAGGGDLKSPLRRFLPSDGSEIDLVFDASSSFARKNVQVG